MTSIIQSVVSAFITPGIIRISIFIHGKMEIFKVDGAVKIFVIDVYEENDMKIQMQPVFMDFKSRNFC